MKESLPSPDLSSLIKTSGSTPTRLHQSKVALRLSSVIPMVVFLMSIW